MNADGLRTTERAVLEVSDVLDLLPLSQRSLRRALEPGGDLEHLVLRVGRRCFIKVAPLRALLELTPDMDEGAPDKPPNATTHDEKDPRRNDSRLRPVR